jgi:hypothetical protein
MSAIGRSRWSSNLICSLPERAAKRLSLSRLLCEFATQPLSFCQDKDLAYAGQQGTAANRPQLSSWKTTDG